MNDNTNTEGFGSEDAGESFSDISQNRTLLALQLTDTPPLKAEIVHGLQNIDAVFKYFKPSITVAFERAESSMVKEELQFKNKADFTADGILNQSVLLKGMRTKKEEYLHAAKQLQTHPNLREALKDKSVRAAMLQSIKAMKATLQEFK